MNIKPVITSSMDKALLDLGMLARSAVGTYQGFARSAAAGNNVQRPSKRIREELDHVAP